MFGLTMGTSSFQRKTSLPENLLRNTDNTNRRVITTPDTKFIDKLRFSLEQKPGYDFMDIKTPTADYVVNAGRMFPDPIGNLGHHRGRAEMANQHNFLLGATDNPSVILSGDQGFANLSGGNTIRQNIAGINYPERGKNVPDINTKISPLLRETFNLNTPFEGTFMKFPRNENYRRRIDGSMPRTSYILNQEGHPRDGSTFGLDEYNWKAFADNPNIDSPIYKALYKDKFNLFNPFKKRQFFDNQGNPFDLNTDLFKKEKGGSLPKAQLQLGKYGDDILKYSDDFLNIFRTTKPNVVSPLYTPLVTPSKYLQTQQLQPYQIRDLNEISNKSLPLNSLANTISESALGNFSSI